MHRLEEPLHVRGQGTAVNDKAAGTFGKTGGETDFAHLFTQFVFEVIDQGGIFFLCLFDFLFFAVELNISLGDRLEVFLLVLVHGLHHPVIDGIGHKEYIIALFAEILQRRVGGDGLDFVAGDIVDILLALGHGVDVFGKGDTFSALGIEALVHHQIFDLFGVGKVGVESLLDHSAELDKEFLVVFAVIFEQFFQLAQHLADHGLFDFGKMGILLQYLAGNVERQVAGVHHAADETQIVRNELFALIGDEYTLDVELESLFLDVRHQQIEGGSLGQEEQGLELADALGGNMDGLEVFSSSEVGEVAVKALVLIFGDLGRFAQPDGFL